MNGSRFILKTLLAMASLCAVACDGPVNEPTSLAATPRTFQVEASCGECQFGLPGEGCTLAVRFGDAAYFVEGSGIDDHGDAHGPDGLCNAIRRAEVTGHVENGRFLARRFVLAPSDP